MGKRSKCPDADVLFRDGICTRCVKRPRATGGPWCDQCHINGRRIAASRRSNQCAWLWVKESGVESVVRGPAATARRQIDVIEAGLLVEGVTR